MTEKPLSERIKQSDKHSNWKRGALDHNGYYEYIWLGFKDKEDEELYNTALALESDRDQLKEQVAELERWEARNIATKKEWGQKLTEAEDEVKRLTEELKIIYKEYSYAWEHKDNILKKKDYAEARLSQAQELVEKWHKQFTKETIGFQTAILCADELKKALVGEVEFK